MFRRSFILWSVLSGLSFTVGTVPCRGQQDSLLIVNFENLTTQEFVRNNPDQTFPDELGKFSEKLAAQIRSSKVIGLFAKNVDATVGKDLMRSRSGMERERNKQLADLSKRFTSYGYFLIGRIWDDGTDFLFVSGKVYRATTDTSASAEPAVFSIEARESMTIVQKGKWTLVDYLVDRLLEQIEARFMDKIRVSIKPLEYRGENPKYAYLGPVIADLVRTRLNVSHRIRVLEPDIAVHAGRDSSSRYRASTLPRPGKREAPKYIISGSFFEYNESIGVVLSEADMESGHIVSSTSVLVDSKMGRGFYDTINVLGDDFRRAVELDDQGEREGRRTTAIAVVPLPPFPPSEANKATVMEVVRRVVGKLRILAAKQPLIAITTDENRNRRYVSTNVDRAVMGRELDAQYLWVVRCERPGRDFSLSFELFNVKNPNVRSAIAGPVMARAEDFNATIQSMTTSLLGDSALFWRGVGKATRDSILVDMKDKVKFPVQTRKIAVVAAPALDEHSNRRIGINIARTTAAKLRALTVDSTQLDAPQLDVAPADLNLGAYYDQELDDATLIEQLRPEYLWRVKLESPGMGRRLTSTLLNVTNPYESPIQKHYTIAHLDNLNEIISTMTRETVTDWLGLSANNVRRMDDIEYQGDLSSIRARASLIGILPHSADVFLGNTYRTAIELSGIYYALPWQWELCAAYDFGKREGDRLVYGRYITLGARYNFLALPQLRDLRPYIGLGISMLNVVRVSGTVGGEIVGGCTFSGGVEVPLEPVVYLDLNSQFILPWRNVPLGHASRGDYGDGYLNSIAISIGIGYRL